MPRLPIVSPNPPRKHAGEILGRHPQTKLPHALRMQILSPPVEPKRLQRKSGVLSIAHLKMDPHSLHKTMSRPQKMRPPKHSVILPNTLKSRRLTENQIWFKNCAADSLSKVDETKAAVVDVAKICSYDPNVSASIIRSTVFSVCAKRFRVPPQPLAMEQVAVTMTPFGER